MQRSSGAPDVMVGMIDGPIFLDHPDLAARNIHVLDNGSGECSLRESIACQHGTCVAGILWGRRGSAAPAICPDCSYLLRPIFPESSSNDMPVATPLELAAAIRETIEHGAQIVNLSAAVLQPTPNGVQKLREALDSAAARNVIIVVAAGNQATIGSSALTHHPWVIPVAGCHLNGRPLSESNFGKSIGRFGLCAPAEGVTSLGGDGQSHLFGGTSAAAPFVTGTIALLWSLFSSATAAQIKSAVVNADGNRRAAIVPPLLDAEAAYRSMAVGRSN